MRPSSLMVLIDAACTAIGLFLSTLTTDIGLIEDLTGTRVPTIWATFARYEQVLLLVALGVAVLVAVLARKSRFGAPVILASAAVGGFLVWQGRSDAVTAAGALAADLDGAVRDGLIAWSPRVGPGPGFTAALIGWGAAALGAVWGIFGRGPGDEIDASGGVGSETDEEPRYIEVVIDDGGAGSVGE